MSLIVRLLHAITPGFELGVVPLPSLSAVASFLLASYFATHIPVNLSLPKLKAGCAI